jgi:hypothetical protein
VKLLSRLASIAASLRMLVLACVLATPGIAQAAGGECAHAAIAQSVAQAAATDADCHTTKAAPVDHDQKAPGQHDDKRSTCCMAGKSCAGAQHLVGDAAHRSPLPSVELRAFAQPARLASLSLLPDYPPPRA